MIIYVGNKISLLGILRGIRLFKGKLLYFVLTNIPGVITKTVLRVLEKKV